MEQRCDITLTATLPDGITVQEVLPSDFSLSFETNKHEFALLGVTSGKAIISSESAIHLAELADTYNLVFQLDGEGEFHPVSNSAIDIHKIEITTGIAFKVSGGAVTVDSMVQQLL